MISIILELGYKCSGRMRLFLHSHALPYLKEFKTSLLITQLQHLIHANLKTNITKKKKRKKKKHNA